MDEQPMCHTVQHIISFTGCSGKGKTIGKQQWSVSCQRAGEEFSIKEQPGGNLEDHGTVS